jgi:hypothetical protein
MTDRLDSRIRAFVVELVDDPPAAPPFPHSDVVVIRGDRSQRRRAMETTTTTKPRTPWWRGPRVAWVAFLGTVAVAAVVAVVAIVLATDSNGSNEALSEDDFVGMWVSNDGVYVQFNENGTLTASFSLDGLAEGTTERGQWNLDGSEFTWAGDEDSPSCAGQASRYTVEPAGNGAVKWTAIGDDPCPPRASDLRRGPMRPNNP